MRAQSAGAIVNVSSATSLRLFPGLGGYSATKAALNLLSQVARLELAGTGVNVSVVYPSVTATEFHQKLRAGHLAPGARHIVPDPPSWWPGPSSWRCGPAKPMSWWPSPPGDSARRGQGRPARPPRPAGRRVSAHPYSLEIAASTSSLAARRAGQVAATRPSSGRKEQEHHKARTRHGRVGELERRHQGEAQPGTDRRSR